MPRSAAIFDQVTRGIISRFVYVADQKQYGKLERWNDLQEVAHNKLAGDCEDFAISIVNQSVVQGAELSDFTLYMVAVGDGPDHVVLGCYDDMQNCIWIADCNANRLRKKSEDFYFKWVSERNLGQSKWVNSSD